MARNLAFEGRKWLAEARRGLFAVLVLLLAASLPASAQEAAEFRAMSLETLMDVKVVSATKTDERILDVPSSVTVFTRSQMDALGVRELSDLVNHVPGWQGYSSDRWNGEPVISSRGRRLGYASRSILILVDGIRVNREWSGAATTMWPHLSLVTAERVEFIRGPGSAIYGSNAFMGVVNVVTQVDGTHASASATGPDAFRIESASSWFAGPVEGSTGLSWVRDDDQDFENAYDNVNDTMVDAPASLESLDIFQRFAWGPLRLDLDGAMNWSQGYYFTGRFSDTGRGRNTRALARLQAEHAWTDRWTSNASFGLAFAREELEGPFTAEGEIAAITLPSSDARIEGDSDHQEFAPTLLIENRFDPSESHHLLLGYEWRRPVETKTEVIYNVDYEALLAGNFPIAAPDGTAYVSELAPHTHREIHGAFAQWTWHADDRATLTLGGRFDTVEDVDSAFSPRAAVVVRPDDRTSLKLMYGQAFRAPTIQEMFITNNPLIVGNPDLGSEIARTTELGAFRRVGPSLVGVTWFWTVIEDAIVQANQGDRLMAANSLGNEIYQGLEVELDADLTRSVRARLTLTHLYDRPEMSHSEARSTGSLSIAMTRGPWSGALSGYVHSPRSYRATAVDQQIDLDPRAELRIHQSWQMTDQTSLFAVVDNLLDDDGRTPSGTTNNPFGAPVQGRRFELGVRVDLNR